VAGPHPPNPAAGTDGRQQPPSYSAAAPNQPETLDFPHDEPAPPPAPYPGPPPYPRKRHPRRLLIGVLLAIALVAGLTTAIIYGVRTNGSNAGNTFSENSARTAIQGYLNALAHRDTEVIARNGLCGIYDAVKDKRTDQALAKLSSDAFRKQFSEVSITSIDKVVFLSQYQAQVLFSMQTTPASGGPSRGPVQGIAQLLFQRGQILVCSYVLRTAGQY
jgi:hypothetical protein